jgi:hypothetical protein
VKRSTPIGADASKLVFAFIENARRRGTVIRDALAATQAKIATSVQQFAAQQSDLDFITTTGRSADPGRMSALGDLTRNLVSITCIPPVAQEIEREPQQACVSRNTKTWRWDVDHSEE